MANTVNNIWHKIYEFENLYRAYRMAGHGKRYHLESLSFAKELEDNLIGLRDELVTQQYVPSGYRQFFVYDPKKRLICAPMFRDRIVHHALVQIIEPYFEKRFVATSFACRKNMGTHAAMKCVFQYCKEAQYKWNGYYVLKCDIHKFFPSINHDILKKIIRRTISDNKVLQLIDSIIDSYNQNASGIPIGSLTSQLFANIYLDQLDHYLKDKLGVKYYVRYMDDFIIIDKSKKHLKAILEAIKKYIEETLDLRLNPKTSIFMADQGVDFCGYRIWPWYIKPRKSTIKRAKRRFRKMVKTYMKNPSIINRAHQSIQSFLGYMRYCSGSKTINAVLQCAIFTMHGGYP